VNASAVQREMTESRPVNDVPNGNGAEPYKAKEPKKPEPLIITMDQIKAEKVDWLWKNRIPIGRLTMLDGDPGSGKSTLSLVIASAVSRGLPLPFGEKPKAAANVLLMSCEDGYSDTIRPRLDSAGADVSRIVIPNPGRGLATTMLNASFIEQAVKIAGPALVIVDPIVAFARGKNTDKANEVRELLSPLMSIAERHALACLVIRHFTKQVDARAMYRGAGSVDFMAACRSAFIIVESDEEPTMRVLAQVKNSLGPKSPSLGFYIDEKGFRWGREVDTDAEGLLTASRSDTRRKERAQLEAAQRFLEETLSNGPMASNELISKAQEAGISKSTIWRAKDELGIKASKERGNLAGKWLWELPYAHARGSG
jgi:RecA-family ATPase